MNVYFRVGLRELAMAAGYNGSNLTALETSSNFRHTFLFLLEAFAGCTCMLSRWPKLGGKRRDKSPHATHT